MLWNIRGLGQKEKRGKIKKLVRSRSVDVLLLQETKRSNVDEMFVKSVWPFELMQFMAVDSEGSAGGLLCVWNQLPSSWSSVVAQETSYCYQVHLITLLTV